MKHFFLCLAVCLVAVASTAQNLRLDATQIPKNAYQPSLRQQFADFQVFELPANDLIRQIETNRDAINLHINLPGFGAIETELKPVNLLSDDYKTVIQSEKGIEISDVRPSVYTYQGKIAGAENSQVALTIADEMIVGYFKMADGNTYYMEPLWHFEPKADKNKVLWYNNSDVLESQAERQSIAKEVKEYQTDKPDYDNGGTRPCSPVKVECAIANDYEMVQKFNTISNVIAHTITVMNLVQTNYDFEFYQPVRLQITSIFVSSCYDCDPWPHTPDYDELFIAFADWFNAGGFGNVSFDWALLLTPREINNNIAGYTLPDGMCTYYRATLVIDYTDILCKIQKHVAHGLGISFGASTASYGVMKTGGTCTDEWHPSSISQINNALATKPCLSVCSANPPFQPEIFKNIYTPYQVCYTFDNACVASYQLGTNDPNLTISTLGTTICLQSTLYNPRTAKVYVSALDYCGKSSDWAIAWTVKIDQDGLTGPDDRDANGNKPAIAGLNVRQNNDYLFVEDASPLPGEKEIRLFDLNGKLLLQQQDASGLSKIALQGLPQGIYMAHVTSGETTIVTKVFHF